MGLTNRILALLAGAAAFAALPVQATASRTLETEFDAAFSGKKVESTAPAAGSQAASVPLLSMTRTMPGVASLEASVAMLAESSQGRIGIAALDLTNGRSLAVLGDQPFPMASTSKIAIVATFLSGVDEGRYKLTDTYPLMVPVPSKKFDGVVAPVRAGNELTAQRLIELCITRSDNQATDALLAAVGGPAVVTRWVHAKTGITEFRLDRDIATLVRDDGAINPATRIDPRDSITPLGMVRLLTGLYRGVWLSPDSSELLMEVMGRTVTGKRRIRALLPEGTQVAHKTGTLFNTASDVGFITTPDGRDLAVAIYVTGQGSKLARDARIAALARALYDGYLAESSSQRRTALR